MIRANRPIGLPGLRGASRRGALLVLVIWLIVVLAVMAYSLTYEMRIGLKMTSQGKRRVQARAVARVGLARAVVDLKNDQLITAAVGQYDNDHLGEIWAQNDEKTEVEVGDEAGVYTVRVVDEQGKLDLNNLRPISAEALAYLLEEVSRVQRDDALLMAQAAVDYFDPDMDPIAATGVTETDYYTEEGWRRFARTLPEGWYFKPKNDPYLAIEELLEVPGFTREILYGEPGETIADPIERLDSRERSSALVDYVAAGRGGPVNLNTAPEEVIAAILAAATQGAQGVESQARRVVQLRDELAKRPPRPTEPNGLTSLNQLAEAGLGEDMVSRMVVVPIGFSSRNYTIISRGTVDGVNETIRARVGLEMRQYNLSATNEPALKYMIDPAAMGWLNDQPDVVVDPAVRVIQMSGD